MTTRCSRGSFDHCAYFCHGGKVLNWTIETTCISYAEMAPKMPNTTPIWDILHEKTVEGSRVNVLGIVVGFRAPVPTRREGKAYHSVH
jgi:hypothetical protein